MPTLSKEMNDAFVNQIKVEMDSFYVYLAMSYWFADKELENLAAYYKAQGEEEKTHAEKLAQFVLDTDGKVKFQAIAEPKNEYSSVDEALEAALRHEEFVTGEIHKMYSMMEEKKEYICKPILDWFVNEQIEEEDNARKMIEVRKYINNDYYYDHRIRRFRGSE